MLVVGILVGKISEWYTSDHYKTVKEIARQAETGPATVTLASPWSCQGLLDTRSRCRRP
ncbi:MAG: hypothetical protein R2823_05150 [Acidimicrobiia bacterium]